MKKAFDFLIVGAGLFGSVFAYEATKKGKKCLVIDKRSHIGGNIYTESNEEINIHVYGPHIFHTSDKKIWDYINQFANFNSFINAPLAIYKNEIYNLPFNMNTFSKLWNIFTPAEAMSKIQEEITEMNIDNPLNLEEQAIKLVGKTIYEKLIKGYTEKQWGKKASDLPPFIIKRLPVRFTYDNNYYNDTYQGVPIGGYTQIIEKMLSNCEVRLHSDFFDNQEYYESIAHKVIFTGQIDKFFNYCYGPLEYRTIHYENEIHNQENYQGNAVINYTDIEIPFTRIIEHKHFEFGKQKKTIISKEYSDKWNIEKEPYYPINDEINNNLYQKYRELALKKKNVIFGGRLGMYKYFDMHQIIHESLNLVHSELDKK